MQLWVMPVGKVTTGGRGGAFVEMVISSVQRGVWHLLYARDTCLFSATNVLAWRFLDGIERVGKASHSR